jgi:hypothetical protein
MYTDYSTWETFDYTLTSLLLDVSNPRINYVGKSLNQTEIIQYLIENEKVYELAKKISEEGYFIGEDPIICIENNKKIVLEGNRRTASLKLLQDPKKYLSSAKANVLLKNIVANNFQVDRKLKCHIAPNRLLANPIIYSRHRGDALEKWKTGNQYAFVAHMYHKDGLSVENIGEILYETSSKIKEYLKAYNLFYEAQQFHLKETGEFIDISKFDITNLERFYKFDDARKFLGIDFNSNDGGLQILIDKPEYEKRLNYMFNEILNAKSFSREFNNDDDKKAYVKKLEEVPLFNFNAKKNNEIIEVQSTAERTNLDEAKNKVTLRKKPRKHIQINNIIIPRDYYISFDNEKLDLLFEELKQIPIERYYSFAILIRTYLEQVLYFYIDKNGLTEKINEKANLKRKNDGLAKIKSLIAFIKGKYKVKEEIEEGDFMRILRFDGDKEYSNSLKIMLDYVKNFELKEIIDEPSKLKNINDYLDNVKNGLDLAVHNINYTIDINVNRRAWNTLEPLFNALSQNINKL